MHVVDLTHSLTPGPPVFEGDPAVTLERTRTHEADGYQVTAIGLGSHSGTHLDAPRHFFAEGATLDSYPADRLVRPGWVVDARPRNTPPPPGPGNIFAAIPQDLPFQPPTDALPFAGAAATMAGAATPYSAATPPHEPSLDDQPIYRLPVIDAALLAERLRGARLEPGDFLLLWTGGALLTADAAPLLLRTGAGLVGADAPSLDDHPYPVHRALLAEGVLLAENLANLDKLGPGPVTCAFLPLAVPDADGAPVRAVAWKGLLLRGGSDRR